MPKIGNQAIHEEDNLWYFWDESWASRQGPFESKDIALKQLKKYCDWLDDGPTINMRTGKIE